MQWKRISLVTVLVIISIFLVGFFIPFPKQNVAKLKIQRLPEEVWTVISNYQEYSEWWPEALPAEPVKGPPNERFKVQLPNGETTIVKTTVYQRPLKLVRTLPNDKDHHWEFSLIPVNDGTFLTVSERGHLTGALITQISESLGWTSRLSSFRKHLDEHLN